jgi:hypothetical protein
MVDMYKDSLRVARKKIVLIGNCYLNYFQVDAFPIRMKLAASLLLYVEKTAFKGNFVLNM